MKDVGSERTHCSSAEVSQAPLRGILCLGGLVLGHEAPKGKRRKFWRSSNLHHCIVELFQQFPVMRRFSIQCDSCSFFLLRFFTHVFRCSMVKCTRGPAFLTACQPAFCTPSEGLFCNNDTPLGEINRIIDSAKFSLHTKGWT